MPGSMVERKYIDATVTSAFVSTTASIDHISAITQGPGAIQRIGSKVLIRSIQCKGCFRQENAVDGAVSLNSPPQSIRLLVIIDKQPNGATPAITDVLESNSVFSPINMAYRDRFIVVKDKLLTLGGVATTATANQISYGGECIKNINFYKKLRFVMTFANVATGTIADVRTNALHWIMLGQTASGESDATFSGFVRVRFQDA